MEDSRILYEGNPAWSNYVLYLGLAGLFLLMSLISGTFLYIAGFFAFIVVIKRFGCHAKVTGERIITKFGILNTKTFEIDIKDIRSINVSQDILQKLFGIGNLEFATESGSVKEAAIIGVGDPERLKELIRSVKANPLPVS